MSSLPGCHFKAVFKVRTWTTGGRIWKLRICMTCMYINITFYLYISFYIILYLSICMDGFMDERTDWRTDGWMDDFMGGWMDWSIWNHNKSIKHNKPTQNKKHLPSHSDFKSFSLHQLTADIQQGLRLAKPQASRNWDQVRRETSRTISLHWELAIPKWLNSQTLRKRSEDLTRHPRTFHTSARQVPFLGPQIHTSGYSGQYLGCWSWEVFSRFSLKKMRRKLQETVLFDVCLLKNKNTDFGSILARTPRCIPSHHHPSTTARKRHSAHELAARLRSAGRLQLHQSKACLVENKGGFAAATWKNIPKTISMGLTPLPNLVGLSLGCPPDSSTERNSEFVGIQNVFVQWNKVAY